MQGNAELGFINNGLKQRLDNVFQSANNRNLGDVFQSMNIINEQAYLVINNSGKIEINAISAKSRKQKFNIINDKLRSKAFIDSEENTDKYLNTNYRCNKGIVDMTNAIISFNTDKIDKKIIHLITLTLKGFISSKLLSVFLTPILLSS